MLDRKVKKTKRERIKIAIKLINLRLKLANPKVSKNEVLATLLSGFRMVRPVADPERSHEGDNKDCST